MIRSGMVDDAEEISRVVLSALHEIYARDCGSNRVARSIMPDGSAATIETRQIFVALDADRIVGTASRDGGIVRSVFVEPDPQGRGIRQSLMAESGRPRAS